MTFLKRRSDLSSFAFLPIFPLRNTEGWRKINIYECAERLVPLSTVNLDQIVVDSRYYKERYSNAMKECYVRETVAQQLCKASEMLPLGWKIVIFDAWRPVALQLQIFEKYKAKLKNKYPEYPAHRLNQEVQRYVSFP